MFDIIGGTSTGGILATALGVRKASLLEAEEIYRCACGYAAHLRSTDPWMLPMRRRTRNITCSCCQGAGSCNIVVIMNGRTLSTQVIWRTPCLGIYKPLRRLR